MKLPCVHVLGGIPGKCPSAVAKAASCHPEDRALRGALVSPGCFGFVTSGLCFYHLSGFCALSQFVLPPVV